MRVKKTTKRKKRHHPFPVALRVAKSQLALFIKTREQLLRDLQVLNVDIPNLERTVRALEAQLGGTGPVTRPTSQSDDKKVGEVPPKLHLSEIGTFSKQEMEKIFPGSTGDEIPPEIRAQLPPEDFTGIGSHFGNEQPEPGEDAYLPKIEGKPVIPEKQ